MNQEQSMDYRARLVDWLQWRINALSLKPAAVSEPYRAALEAVREFDLMELREARMVKHG